MQQRALKPYLFYGQTQSLCETCLHPVPAKILIEDDRVYFQKRCDTHGVQKTLVSTDADYSSPVPRLAEARRHPAQVPVAHPLRLSVRLRPVPGP